MGAMSLRTQPRTAVRHALWLGGLLVILGGLFGMHGLANHGGDHGGAAIEAVAHAAMTVPAHAARTVAGVDTAGVDTVAVVGVMIDPTGHSAMGMGTTGMCMAVLVLSLLLLILRLHVSRVPPLLWSVARSVRSPLVRGRDPDPPSLFRLSIQRC